jgi:hypothetical protein
MAGEEDALILYPHDYEGIPELLFPFDEDCYFD